MSAWAEAAMWLVGILGAIAACAAAIGWAGARVRRMEAEEAPALVVGIRPDRLDACICDHARWQHQMDTGPCYSCDCTVFDLWRDAA